MYNFISHSDLTHTFLLIKVCSPQSLHFPLIIPLALQSEDIWAVFHAEMVL